MVLHVQLVQRQVPVAQPQFAFIVGWLASRVEEESRVGVFVCVCVCVYGCRVVGIELEESDGEETAGLVPILLLYTYDYA